MFKKLYTTFIFFIYLISLHSNLAAEDTKKTVLVGSPIRQKPAILKEFLDSLNRLDKSTIDFSYMFVDDNDNPESKELLKSFCKEHEGKCTILDGKELAAGTGSYVCNEENHQWTNNLVWKVAAFKDYIIYHAKYKFDYLFLVDSDIVLYPETIKHLIRTKKEIISEIFWTRWSPDTVERPQVWMTGACYQYDREIGEELDIGEICTREWAFLNRMKIPGIYEVGGLGACTLISQSALKKGVCFKRITNLDYPGEDRHFCIRAKALEMDLFVDTHYPAYHIYRESALEGVPAYLDFILKTPLTLTHVDFDKVEALKKHRITLSMILGNEEDRYLREMLTAVRDYITDAVIIDDASTDNSVAIVDEILKDIPHKIIRNNVSKFSNEHILRKQQWDETAKTNPEWILTLDADQIFEDNFKDHVQNILDTTTADLILFRLYDMWDKNHYRDDQYWSAHHHYSPVLVRYKPELAYTWNETPQHCGQLPNNIYPTFSKQNSEFRLKHFGWAREDVRKAKYIRYQQLDPGAKYGWKEQYESILDPSPNLVAWDDYMDSRFIVNKDPSVKAVAGVELPNHWWSRPHEYAWAEQFAGSNFTVLDAACGISHPFKWYLGENCYRVWACDTDKRIINFDQLTKETKDDLGQNPCNVVCSKDRLKNVVLARASISALPDSMPQFDRIFCISTLEHLNIDVRKQVLQEFARKLQPDGLLVLTVDYPEVTPERLISEAAAVGLLPAGSIQVGTPPPDAVTSNGLYVYRAVFRHRTKP